MGATACWLMLTATAGAVAGVLTAGFAVAGTAGLMFKGNVVVLFDSLIIIILISIFRLFLFNRLSLLQATCHEINESKKARN